MRGMWEGGLDAVEDYLYLLRGNAAQAFAMHIDRMHLFILLAAISLRFLETGTAHVIPRDDVPARPARYRKMPILSRVNTGYRCACR